MNSKYHECSIINQAEDVSIEKINGSWTWVFWGKNINQGHGIKYCPYCGAELGRSENLGVTRDTLKSADRN